jgi:hypothetical protein
MLVKKWLKLTHEGAEKLKIDRTSALVEGSSIKEKWVKGNMARSRKQK